MHGTVLRARHRRCRGPLRCGRSCAALAPARSTAWLVLKSRRWSLCNDHARQSAPQSARLAVPGVGPEAGQREVGRDGAPFALRMPMPKTPFGGSTRTPGKLQLRGARARTMHAGQAVGAQLRAACRLQPCKRRVLKPKRRSACSIDHCSHACFGVMHGACSKPRALRVATQSGQLHCLRIAVLARAPLPASPFVPATALTQGVTTHRA